jgi:hypothetical protein
MRRSYSSLMLKQRNMTVTKLVIRCWKNVKWQALLVLMILDNALIPRMSKIELKRLHNNLMQHIKNFLPTKNSFSETCTALSKSLTNTRILATSRSRYAGKNHRVKAKANPKRHLTKILLDAETTSRPR